MCIRDRSWVKQIRTLTISIDFCKVPEDLFSGSRFCILQLIVNKTSIKSIGGNVLWYTINFATQT